MSLAKDKIWKLLAPLVVMGVMFLIPVPDGMPPQAWHYFAVFVAMIVGMILEPIPATAISFIAVTICVIAATICCLMLQSWPTRRLKRVSKR